MASRSTWRQTCQLLSKQILLELLFSAWLREKRQHPPTQQVSCRWCKKKSTKAPVVICRFEWQSAVLAFRHRCIADWWKPFFLVNMWHMCFVEQVLFSKIAGNRRQPQRNDAHQISCCTTERSERGKFSRDLPATFCGNRAVFLLTWRWAAAVCWCWRSKARFLFSGINQQPQRSARDCCRKYAFFRSSLCSRFYWFRSTICKCSWDQ